MKKKPIVAGIGELLWDMLPTGKQLGGAPCNFAFHAMQAGCESIVISAIGKDDLGDELIQLLQKLAISTKHIQLNNFPTSTVTVALDEKGQPAFNIHENVAWDHIQWNETLHELATDLDAVCFGSLAQRSVDSKNTIKSLISALKPGCLKIFDINLRQHYFTKEILRKSIEIADILKLNDEELPVIANYFGFDGDNENQLKQLLRYFKLKYVVYTMGHKGSIILSTDEYSFIKAPKVEVADTVGAGDAFTAILVAGMLQGVSLSEVHKKATDTAAFVCTQKGATPRISEIIY
jgi:fructokinase